ncbi:MAG: 2-dehydro-3-deoxygalactonokinase [Sphingomonadales bacterium]|nr:2-dehydro-3-deoxygalactonokinase [Sphingomonadales bacterium]
MTQEIASSLGENWAAKGFVAVDWGSTARRAYLLHPGGRVVDEFEDDAGILSVPRERLGAEVDALARRFGDVPMLMAGMIGSNRGIVETPYVACPASLSDITAKLTWLQPARIAIVPGLSLLDGARADVMRGEEIQALGLYALGLAGGHTIICHPGTHTKWIELLDGTIAGFRTIMTGELFSLLKSHSILSDVLDNPVDAGAAFIDGVEQGRISGALGAELFNARARVLLGTVKAIDAASFISGLLIGNDVNLGLKSYEAGGIVVLGRSSLTRLFSAAIQHCGRTTQEIDGAAAFTAGMHAIAERIT